MKRVKTPTIITMLLWLLLCLAVPSYADDTEAYTKVFDRLTSLNHFSERPVLFLVGFDTTKSMSVEFDRAKRVTQILLSRYGAPGDSIYIFGFANHPSVLPATKSPKLLPTKGVDSVLATLNEGILGLPRSSEFGTVFGRAKLFALQKAQEYGKTRNVVILLFSDNNSELEMGKDERKKLEAMESSLTTKAETIPLLSQGVSPLWLTLYANSFPDETRLVGPDNEEGLENPRLAWAARRVGSQVLQFIEPAGPNLSSFPADVSVQFLGPTQPKEATLTVDGKNSRKASFSEGRASWTLDQLEPGAHLLFAQAVLPDSKVRTAEMTVQVQSGSASTGPSPTGGGTTGGSSPGPETSSGSPTPSSTSTPSATPTPLPLEDEESSPAPWILLVIAVAIVGGIYLLSTKPARLTVLGPNRKESYLLTKGKVLRIGGSPRVESEVIFTEPSLSESIAQVVGQGFGKAKIFPAGPLNDGSVEIDTDEGHSVLESGEVLLTTATVTWTSERGNKEIFTLVKEDGGSGKGESGEHFAGQEAANHGTDDADWRS